MLLDSAVRARHCIDLESAQAIDGGPMKRQRGTGSIYLQPDSTIWAYQIFINGKRERGSTGHRNKREAEAFVRRKQAEYSVGLSSPGSHKIGVTELVEDLLLNKQKQRQRESFRRRVALEKPFTAISRTLSSNSSFLRVDRPIHKLPQIREHPQRHAPQEWNHQP